MIKFYPTTRNGAEELAESQINSGQIQYPRTQQATRTDEATNVVAALKANYVRALSKMEDQGNIPVSIGYEFLDAQLRSLVPMHFARLFKDLGIELGKDGVPASFALAEPFTSDSPGSYGHYLRPYAVIKRSNNMEMLHHAAGTLAHETTHALGASRISIKDDEIKTRQAGLRTIDSRKTGVVARFTFFNEACAVFTEEHLLKNLLRFKESNEWSWSAEMPKDATIGGLELAGIVKQVGLLRDSSNPNTNIGVAFSFSKLYQGTPLEGGPKDWEKEASENPGRFRTREYVQAARSYGEITEGMRKLSSEIFPDLDAQSAQKAFHKILLLTNMTGNLRQLFTTIAKGLGENGKLYARALACLSDLSVSGTNTELIAFKCFVAAGNLPAERREEVRKTIAIGILKSHKLQA